MKNDIPIHNVKKNTHFKFLEIYIINTFVFIHSSRSKLSCNDGTVQTNLIDIPNDTIDSIHRVYSTSQHSLYFRYNDDI